MKLTVQGCRERQKGLLTVLEQRGLDGAIISRREHVYYFTGFLHGRHQAAAAFIGAGGRAVLVGDGVPEQVAADEVVAYQAGRFYTLHSEQYEEVAEKLKGALPGKARRLGADLGGGIACVAATGGNKVVDLTRDIYGLRKCKLADEVDALRDAIGITEVMYTAAKQAIHPGADEVEVLAHIRAEATRAAGEDLEHFGNDFRANDMGGSARRRRMEAGELYILDAGPSLHGYFADNCRTFAVDRSPEKAQIQAWRLLDGLFAQLEGAIKPGVRASDVYSMADAYLRAAGHRGLVHHLGHGVGMAVHETPELNPEYAAQFEIGDVFTMEPGLYSKELRAGIRLEENYRLGEEGLEKLTSFPRSLV